MRKLNIITNSSRNCYMTCPRKYYNRYVLEIVGKDRGELTFGSGAHVWLDAWWEPSIAKDSAMPELDDPFATMKLQAMLVGYDARWHDWKNESVSGVRSELQFRVPLVNPDTGRESPVWELMGKLDKHALIDGAWSIVEHKTSSDVTDGYFERLRIDSQLSTYMDPNVCKQLELEPPEGVLYDVLRKPMLRPYEVNSKRKIAETPEEYYQRCLADIASKPEEYYHHYAVVRLDLEIHEARRNTWFTAAMIRESMNADRWPQNTNACRQYHSFCEYWGLCTGTMRLNDYEHKPAHSELSL